MENQECDDEDMVAMRSEDPCWSERHSLYSDDENEKLEKLGEMMFHVNCFMYLFHDTCFEEVLGEESSLENDGDGDLSNEDGEENDDCGDMQTRRRFRPTPKGEARHYES